MKKYATIPLPDDFEPGRCDECPVSYVGCDEYGDTDFVCSIGMDHGKCQIKVKEFVPVSDIVDDVFCQMRDATEQEQKSVSEFVERISKPTGVNFYDGV